MEKYFEILRNCPLFLDIQDKDLIPLLACLGARVESFGKKYTIFAEGTPSRYIGIVLSGKVQIIQLDYYGNRSIIAEAGPGELFSEAFACAGLDSAPVSAIADEDSEIMLIDCHCITHTCSNSCEFHQQIIFNLMKNLAAKNIMFLQRIQITSKRTTREKLLEYLATQAKKHNSSTFDIPFDRQELADYLEVDRSGLSAEISKLRNEGVLKSKKSRFTLL